MINNMEQNNVWNFVKMLLLASIVNPSNHTKSVSLGYQKCETQPALINLHRNV